MKKSILSILLFLFCSLIIAQKKQPKIGLVLSGGGAKGFAHIGVLKEIDKAGLQIDYIGGTSMGAIIAGLYASGYTAIQIEDLVSKVDFVKILQDEIPRNLKPYFEKEFGEKHAVSLPVMDNRIQIPSAVSKGQLVLDLLTEILAPVDSIKDFSKLPIPFYCISTDSETGEKIIMESGSLPLALRSSGSFPTLLNPVELDGKLLIDGGVADNFPTDIMLQKGMDYIIGVDVQSDLRKKTELNSVVRVLNQIVNFNIAKQSEKGRRLANLYIQPDITSYTVIDFERAMDIIKKGEQVAKDYKPIFDSIAGVQTIKKIKKPIQDNDNEFIVKSLRVEGAKNFTPAFVRGRLNLQTGDKISKKLLNEKIGLLTSTENYDRIEYSVDADTVYIKVKERKEKISFRLGAHYDQLYQSGILANYVNKSVLIKNDQLSAELVLGDKVRYNLNYFVDNGFYISYGFKSRYNHFRTNTQLNYGENSTLNKSNLSYTDFSNEIFVQTTFGRKFAIGGGIEFKDLKISTETVLQQDVNSEFIFDNSTYINGFAYLKLDTYDDSVFPTKGFYADVGGKLFFSSTDYRNNFKEFAQIGGRLGFATTFGERLTFQYINDAGFTFNNPQSDIFDFVLGGYNQNYINNFVPLYGYEFGQLSGNSFLRSEFLFRYEIFKNNYASFIANYARVDNNVFSDGDLFKDVLSGYAVGYSIKTIVGPIEIKYSWSPENNDNYWLFNLGFWF